MTMVVGIVGVLLLAWEMAIFFTPAAKNRPPNVPPASEVQADPPKPVEPSTADSVTFHAKPIEADVAPFSETPPTIPTPSNVEPPKPEPSQPEPPATVTDKSTSPQQPKEWNPGVRRPSETITLIPSGKFDDDEEEE